jgi:hypothetical protein
MPRPPHSPWFHHPKNIWWGTEVMKFLFIQLSPWSVFLPLSPNILNTLFSKPLNVPPSKWETKFRTHTVQLAELQLFVYFNLHFFIWGRKTKDFGLNDNKHSLNLIYCWFHHECHPKVFECCHIFKRFISYPYILVLSWVLMTGHDHILCLLCIYF